MIFEDPSNKRWKITLYIFIAVTIVAAVLISLTIYSFVVNSPIPTLGQVNQKRGIYIKNLLKKNENDNTASNSGTVSEPTKKISRKEMERIKKLSKEKSNIEFSDTGFIHSAFIVQGEPASVDDLKKHIDSLELVFPDWLTFTGEKSEIDENIDSTLLEYLKSHKAKVFPRISNCNQEGKWLGEEFENYIHDSEKRNELALLISATLNKYHVEGINLDFEGIDVSAKNDYLDFLIDLREILHKNNQVLTVDTPMNDDAFDYEAIGQIADQVIVMAYDEHYAGGDSGSIASQEWFADGVSDILKRIPKEKVIVAMGEYAYDWDITKKTPAKSLSFDETMFLAGQVDADVQTDTNTKNCNFSYVDENGDAHQVWLLDAVSLWNQMQVLADQHVNGVSLWRLGLEDPTIWKYYHLDNIESYNPKQLKEVETLNLVNFDGAGEIFRVSALPVKGSRILTFDKNIIDSADYDTLPTSYEVQNYGKSNSRNIVLTFDDGPDPVYTSQILDILKNQNVKATFFVVGDQLQRYPDVFKREVREGHLVGNHTYTHPNLTRISQSSVKLELNSVQRLVEALSGKQTLLFRSPYNTDASPEKPEELRPFYEANSMGYIDVGADIDSMDYDKPGVNKIVNNVIQQLNQTGSNIIVMHDAGGNRQQTVAALKILIPKLRSMGYRFVNINDLLGVSPISIMPYISIKEQLIVWADKIWSCVYTQGWAMIVILFFLSTIISVLRILFLGYFVLKSERVKNSLHLPEGEFKPFITVAVPAYNEENVIGKTLNCLLNSNYKNFEVLVIDDGSTDNTVSVVSEFTRKYSKIRLITKNNEGKFAALNRAFKEAKAEYVVTIDADTMILPDTIENLIAPFKDESVDAVCGNVQVGNVKNILTGFQAVEYITTQNYDRRAFDELNCISVVPGATGAWKKEKVIQAGGYSNFTLTEDADLTLTMLESGAKIVYAPSAKSITEAPETVRTLFKQRFRWSFGTFQCLWKHRKSFLKDNLGWIALPNMFIFQILFPILSPIGDLVFLISIFRGDMKAILSGYLLFLSMDMAASLMAFMIERAPKKYMLFVLIQRFFYRQFMYIVTIKSLISAVKGSRQGWNKINRTNSVNML